MRQKIFILQGVCKANFHPSLLFLRWCSLLSLASSSEVSPFQQLSFVRATPPEYLPHDKKPATSGVKNWHMLKFLLSEMARNWFIIFFDCSKKNFGVFHILFLFKYFVLTAFNRKRSTSTSLVMRIASKYFALMVSCPLGRPSERFELAPLREPHVKTDSCMILYDVF